MSLGFDEKLAGEWVRARRDGSELALATIDIDHFKAYNDTYGHSGGDAGLSRVAREMRDAVRATDLVARYGGEEFVIVFPATGPPDALPVAERVRAAVQALAIEHRASPHGVVTVSIGCAALHPGARWPPRQADRGGRPPAVRGQAPPPQPGLPWPDRTEGSGLG